MPRLDDIADIWFVPPHASLIPLSLAPDLVTGFISIKPARASGTTLDV